MIINIYKREFEKYNEINTTLPTQSTEKLLNIFALEIYYKYSVLQIIILYNKYKYLYYLP